MPAPILGILGQAAPAAGALGDVIAAVGNNRRQVVSTVVVANTGNADTTFRLFARKAGAPAAVGNALGYDVPISANSIVTLTLGITLAATDILTGRSAAGGVTFTAFGEETDVPTS